MCIRKSRSIIITIIIIIFMFASLKQGNRLITGKYNSLRVPGSHFSLRGLPDPILVLHTYVRIHMKSTLVLQSTDRVHSSKGWRIQAFNLPSDTVFIIILACAPVVLI